MNSQFSGTLPGLTQTTEITGLKAASDYVVARSGGTSTIQYDKGGGSFQDYPDQDAAVEITTPPSGRVRIAITAGTVSVEYRLKKPRQ